MTSSTEPEFWTILKTPPKTPSEILIECIEAEMVQAITAEIDREVLANLMKVANENR